MRGLEQLPAGCVSTGNALHSEVINNDSRMKTCMVIGIGKVEQRKYLNYYRKRTDLEKYLAMPLYIRNTTEVQLR